MKTLAIVIKEHCIDIAQEYIQSLNLICTPFLNIYEMKVEESECKSAVDAIEYIFSGVEFTIYKLN